jgi:hypothetical protein
VRALKCTHRNLYFTGGQKHVVCSDCHHGWSCDPGFPKTDKAGRRQRHTNCARIRRIIPNLNTSNVQAAISTRKRFRPSLRPWANWLATRYGVPVWLCGSSLKKGWDARDVDVVIIFPNDVFEQRWGIQADQYSGAAHFWEYSHRLERLQAEIAKVSRVSVNYLHINIDLKLIPRVEAQRYKHLPKVRLDRVKLGGPIFLGVKNQRRAKSSANDGGL